MLYGGIDGCKYGWILMKSDQRNIQFGGIFQSVKDLLEANQDLDRILIDMPIGLSSKGYLRTVDALLRKELQGRHSTVFNVPARASLAAKTHKEASQINQIIEGKKISIQSFFISKKIAELDNLLINRPTLKNKFIESHPELCFKYLNKGTTVLSKKSTKEGIQERLAILKKYDPRIDNLYREVEGQTKKKFVKRDDIIDAICLCLANQLSGKDKMQFIVDPLIEDAVGIRMRVAYFTI